MSKVISNNKKVARTTLVNCSSRVNHLGDENGLWPLVRKLAEAYRRCAVEAPITDESPFGWFASSDTKVSLGEL